ncbi:macrofage activating glycoprotein [Rhodotorula toruloides]|uniref:Macrofage activating glycoprotein n=1 Tax=Rhodotorula toruloides TaxID=5286 RepID=A0A511KAR6_RHOTO|nr:macrofage activating glycoprotein [Rhodotorula toruloides]
MRTTLALASVACALAGTSLVTASSSGSTITAAPSSTQIAKAVKRQAPGSQKPLTQYTYSYSAVPYQVLPAAWVSPEGRGPQVRHAREVEMRKRMLISKLPSLINFSSLRPTPPPPASSIQSGYNICNSTTSGPDSRCQTMVANNASDFCLWGSPTMAANGTIGDDEAAVVAYCTNDKHGARVIPAGAITGLQVMHTSAYIQWTGHINMSALNLQENDTGGELDPHGADIAGNPLGGLVYSNQMPGGNNQAEIQAIEWNNFIGSGVFCLKLCFDNTQKEPFYCQNKFDLLGCSYNMPASYQDNVFLECDGDLQDPVGVYTGSNGQKTTWSQPESLPGTQTLPWTPRVPASSNCKTYQSTELFPATLLGYQSTSAPTVTSGSSSSGAKSGSNGGSSGPSATTAGSSSSSNKTNNGDIVAASVSVSVLAMLVGSIVALA